MRIRALLVSAIVLLVGTTAACGGETAAPEQPAPMAAVAASTPDTLVLRVQELRSGPAPWERGRLPAFSLYGGGRVVVADDPAGALHQAREFQLPVGEFEQLTANARTAGLERGQSHEYTDSTDSSLLLVSLRTTQGLRTTRITAPEVRGTGLRTQVLSYVERLPTAPDGARKYEPTAVAVLATSGVSEGTAGSTPWPLHPLAEGTRTSEGACTAVTGPALTEVTRLAANAQQQTRWSSAGKLYAVSFRPLLPDEHTCGDVDALRR